MTMEQELITEKDPDEYGEWKRKYSAKYAEALKARTVDAAVTKLLDEGARIRVGRMTLKSSRNNLKKIRSEVYGEIHTFAVAPSKAREPALKAVVREARKALKGNFQVRVHVLLMLSELELTPQVPNRNPPVPAVLFPETLPVFLEVIADPKQPEGVRVMAAICAEKVLSDKALLTAGPLSSNNPAKDRTDAARTLIAAIKGQTKTSASYQKALISAVGQISMVTIADAGGAQKPEVQTLLADIIKDVARPIPVRAWAVSVLGKYPLGTGGTGLDTVGVSKAALNVVHQIGSDISTKKLTGNVGFFLVQDIFVGMHAMKTALPSDKAVGTAYASVRDTFKPMLSSVQNSQPVTVDAKTLKSVQETSDGLK